MYNKDVNNAILPCMFTMTVRNSAGRKSSPFATVHTKMFLLNKLNSFHILSCRHRVNATPERKSFVPFSNFAGTVWTGSLGALAVKNI